MKILAIERESKQESGFISEALLREEALHVFHLYLAGTLREIYFTENRKAVVILEVPDKISALNLLNSLPLVETGKIEFDVFELFPYNGYERILN